MHDCFFFKLDLLQAQFATELIKNSVTGAGVPTPEACFSTAELGLMRISRLRFK